MSNYTYEPVSPRSQGFSSSTFSSPRSVYDGSIRTASSRGSCSDEEEAVLRVLAPQAKRSVFGQLAIPEGTTPLGFTDVAYLNDDLKLDPYSRQGRDDGSLNELINLYNSSSIAVPHRANEHQSPQFKVDSIGEEDELEFIDEEPRYSREEKGKSAELSDSDQSLSFSPPHSWKASSLFTEAPALPTSGLTREDIVFRVANINQEPPSRFAAQSELAKAFPSLCEPPARMFGEDGAPLPPTKKEEISAAERAARQEALKVELKGSKVHSLVKSTVVLESRSALWKKVANIDKDASDSTTLALLPELPSPWDMEITHEGLDISTIKSKTRKIFQLPSSKTTGACRKCSGSGSEICRTCRGEAGSECFWCSGSGMQKGRRRCGRCQGQGKLSCMACEDKKAAACRACDGAGCGLYCAFVEVKMRRIEVPAVSVADLLGSSRASAANAHPEIIKAASVDMLWELVKMLATKASVKSKRPYLPVSAVCTWEKSVSYLAEVTAIQNAKFKAGSKQPFRAEGLHRTVPTKTRYFSLPTDPSLPLAELTLDQFVKQNVPEKAVIEVGPSSGVHNVSRRLSTMLLGDVSAPSTPQLSSGGSSPKQSDYFGDAAGAAGAVVSVPVTPVGGSLSSSPIMRPSSARPMSPMRAPPAQFNSDELRIKMLRHASSLPRANFSRPLSAPGIPL
ncbi:hypothetical protein PHSY_000748 [Pseudozyma hubeiensis SY62]|uniref:Uncharacterized protein n=1 Tax=Pseudozyma hubeiensis (strain SY62) TaxID=1305764 RepID=R9P4Z5_PSEHS|nr:hypothetical protein PHSY_000748 [Pseudozyma hubeiensis SY62]GAC93185.1 hypothetical protein PHSY_000748 [Pseudozyma hubeiensis SY62]